MEGDGRVREEGGGGEKSRIKIGNRLLVVGLGGWVNMNFVVFWTFVFGGRVI